LRETRIIASTERVRRSFTMMRRIGLLIGCTLAFWGLAVLACRILARPGGWSETVLVYSGVACGLCLVPTALTLAWASHALRQAPEQQLLMVLGGTGIRLFGVLLGAWGLFNAEFGGELYFQKGPGFWTWVLLFYLFTLALEMTLVIVGRPAGGTVGKPG
jgi:hypothetical protein